MSEFGYNDWRDFLAHAWAQDHLGKIKEHAYNVKYYQEHRNEILERAKARYEKMKNRTSSKNGNASESNTKSESSSSSKGSSKTKEKDQINDLNISDDAPEWLKNYANEIKKVREATGNSNWVPAHVNSFDDWAKELKETYPDLNLSGSEAKEVWSTINKQFGKSESSKKSSKSKAESKSETKSESSKKSESDDSIKTESKVNVAKEHRLDEMDFDKAEAEAKEKKQEDITKAKNAVASIVKNSNNPKSEEAYKSYSAFVNEMNKHGAPSMTEAESQHQYQLFKNDIDANANRTRETRVTEGSADVYRRGNANTSKARK